MGDLKIGIVGFGLVGKRHASALEKTNGLLLKMSLNTTQQVFKAQKKN